MNQILLDKLSLISDAMSSGEIQTGMPLENALSIMLLL